MSVRLRHVATINPSTPEFELLPDTAELPFLPLEAVWPGDRLDTTRRQSKAAVSTGYTRFREGDILLPKITPTFQADRTVIAVGIEGGVGAGTTELHVVRAGPDADVRYLRYLLSSKEFLDEGEASMLGVAGQKRVPDDCLRDLRVPVVDLRHQRAIADHLDRETNRIDALIENYERLKEQLRRRLDARISQATCASWVGMGGPLPSDWRALPLRRCFDGMDYGIGERSQASGPIAVLGMGNVEPRRVVGEPGGYVELLDDRLLLLPGDLLFNRTNSLALVGKVAIWLGGDQPTTFASYLVRLRTSSSADPRYLNLLLNTGEVLALARAIALPSIGQANLNPNRYGSLRIPLPSLSAQRQLASELEVEEKKNDVLTLKLQKQLQLLAEHRQALISAAVNGELAIPEVAA